MIWRGLTELDPGEVPPPAQVANVKENMDFTIHKNVHGFRHVFPLVTEMVDARCTRHSLRARDKSKMQVAISRAFTLKDP